MIKNFANLSKMLLSLNMEFPMQVLKQEEPGALIQNAFPNLKDEEREFIKTGITGEEWTEMFCYPDTDGDY